ncbi:hypothetical protein B5E84_15110 [Lachnoclostridium sp. An14]|nr:hypothetical protein B5E84_15110 [Lachnoclostridium sp. An14]
MAAASSGLDFWFLHLIFMTFCSVLILFDPVLSVSRHCTGVYPIWNSSAAGFVSSVFFKMVIFRFFRKWISPFFRFSSKCQAFAFFCNKSYRSLLFMPIFFPISHKTLTFPLYRFKVRIKLERILV